MASAGTAYVDIRGDFDPLTRDLRAKLAEVGRQAATVKVDANIDPIRAKLEGVTARLREVGAMDVTVRLDLRERAVRQRIAEVHGVLKALSAEEATPEINIAMAHAVEELDRLEIKLAKIGRERVNVKVDVDVGRGLAERALSTFASAMESIPRLASGGIGAISSFGSAMTSLGPFLTGTAIIIGTVLAPAVLLLGASLANAVIGAGALTIALGALAGPVVLVAVAALTRFAAILAAIKEHQQQSSQQAAVVAAAQDQIRAATEGVANAQSTLAQATTDAYRAWQDAIEAVKDDLLSLQQAHLGVDEANLGLRDAKAALRDVRKESGATAGSLDGLFRKFTDVSIDFDPAIFEKALAGANAGLSDEDERRLEHAILNVRAARLRQKSATDAVHDAETKLKRDRSSEQDFAQRGIQAYGPYRAAVQGVVTAQRQLVTAQRQSNQAVERQGKLWDALSPSEQRFARRVERFQDAFRHAFGPATRNLLKGLGTLLDTIGESLNKPGIRASLAILGASIGSMLRGIARELRSKEFQDAFEHFTRSAGHLIRSLGSDAVRTFLRLLVRIATEALPPLESGLRRTVKWLERFVDKVSDAQARNRGFGRADDLPTKSPIERFIDRAIGSFKTWIGIVKDLGRILGGFFKAMLPDGDKLADDFGTIVRHFADWVNSKRGQDSIRSFFHDVRTITRDIAKALGHAVDAAKTLSKLQIQLPKGPVGKVIDLLTGGNPLVKVLTKQSGGIVPGAGRGDIVPAMLEPGEFVVRKAMVQRLGVPFMTALNGGTGFAAGGLVPTTAAGAGAHHHHGDIILKAAPGASGFDAVDGAVRIARLIEQRGGR